MKRLSLYLFLILFTLQAPSWAEDISDFQIEGVSIGDSLLDYHKEYEILNATKTTYPNSKKFYDVHIRSSSINYDQLTYRIKNDDKKYIIYSIEGDKYYDNENEKCLVKKNEIVEEFSILLPDLKKNNYIHKYKTIDDGKSFSNVTDFNFKDGSAIRVWCNVFTQQTLDKRGMFNGLTVSITPIEVLDWITNEAYK